MKRKPGNKLSSNIKKKRVNMTSENKLESKTEESDVPITTDTSDSFRQLLSSLKSSRKILKTLITNNDEKNELEKDSEVSSSEESEDENVVLKSDDNESDEESEDDVEEENDFKDSFKCHFEFNVPEECITEMQKMKNIHSNKTTRSLNNWRTQELFHIPNEVNSKIKDHVTSLNEHGKKLLQEACARENVIRNWEVVNKTKKKEILTPLQEELFQIMGCYKDLFFFDRNLSNGEEVRRLYCMHAVNHVLKTRSRILKNNAKITQAEKDNKEIDDCRDQGLTRPKILILVPFKDSCLQIVNCIIKLVFNTGTKGQVMQKKRFLKEFSPDPEEAESQANRPDDFKKMFKGNIDDCFRLGISMSKNTVKLFSPFYMSDIIVASPLGLRTIIGSEGEKQDFDFLSSIEMLIADQADVFLMQNWEHVLHIFDYLHLTPKKSHDTDFSRVRMWNVNGWSKYYRQTLWFSSIQTPEMSSICNKFSHNYNGKVKLLPKEVHGSVEQIAYQTPQIFQLIGSCVYAEVADKRFEYFINKVLPSFKGQLSNNTAIFIPSYFDFVRVRNHFKKEELSFVQISEYSKRSNISRARNLFHEKKKHFLLFTERFYFFYRYRIRGIKHIIFYELPHYPTFYSEIINFMESSAQQSASAASCTILCSRFDGYKLEAIVGSTRCNQIMSSKKDVHMIVTGS